MQQFVDYSLDRRHDPLYLPEMCIALNISERTLRQCCHEYYGMGPKRYLMLRRLQLARSALLNGDPRTDSVTSIATRFGFWELGRFSGIYYQMFGERPGVTLRHSDK
jgi:transcriptional regulator GlxA family with amidase domain